MGPKKILSLPFHQTFLQNISSSSGRNVWDVRKLRNNWVTHPFSNFIELNKEIFLKQIWRTSWERKVK